MFRMSAGHRLQLLGLWLSSVIQENFRVVYWKRKSVASISQRMHELNAWSVYVGFAVDKLAFG